MYVCKRVHWCIVYCLFLHLAIEMSTNGKNRPPKKETDWRMLKITKFCEITAQKKGKLPGRKRLLSRCDEIEGNLNSAPISVFK